MRWIRAMFAVLVACGSAWADASRDEVEFFEKKIRPVLVEHCHKCHSAKAEKIKGGLVVDSRQELLKGGESGRAAVMPGNPENSMLIEAVKYQGDVQMPPRKKLSDEQIADLVKWVEDGAAWPGEAGVAVKHQSEGFDLAARAKAHWAYRPVVRPDLPVVKDRSWTTAPVDRFILGTLEEKGLQPSAEADRRTLIRRIYFDLIGLPPKHEEIEAFIADESSDAFATVVEKLLASPHYGERWARHWLDLVRYAETAGHEFDFDHPLAYLYRDYVIRAFNDDVPYDQFAREHVAGDLMKHPRRHPAEKYNESIIATGFWHMGESVHSPVDVREDEGSRVDNQIDVFAKTFSALTVACARCHDHKFDAISTKDYYALCGYMRSSRYQEAFIDHPDRFSGHLRELADLRARLVAVAGMALCDVRLDAKLLDAWAASAPQALPKAHSLYSWNALSKKKGEEFAATRRKLAREMAHEAAAERAPREYVMFEDFSERERNGWDFTGHAFDITGSATPLFGSDPGRPIRSILPAGVASSGLLSANLQGALRSPTFVISHDRILYRVAGRGATINLIVHGLQKIREPIYGGLTFKPSSDDFRWHVQDVSRWKGHRAYVELLDNGPEHVSIDQVLFSDAGHPPEIPSASIAAMLADETIDSAEILARKYEELFRDAAQKAAAGDASTEQVRLANELLSAPAGALTLSRSDLADLLILAQRKDAALPAPRRAMAMADGTAYDERVFIRGSYKTPGETVPRRFLEALSGAESAPSPAGSGRLALADRLTSPANPLFARVMVNRIWKHHFGEGLVRSVDDFGVMGSSPSHPKLLDWLADEFRAGGWSIKKMHRSMVLSATYRMSSTPSAKANQIDPNNLLLSHMPRRRLEAEAIRDAMLAVSGRLDLKMFGPSVPPHLTSFMQGRGRPTTSGPLDGDGRRSIYIQVRRNFLTPMLTSFDYPAPFTTMGRRTVSNVPAQALAMMNNPLVVEQSRLWARQALAEPAANANQRIHRLYMQGFSRPPTDQELAAAQAFVSQGKSDDDLDAWSELCHVLLNVKEFIFIN